MTTQSAAPIDLDFRPASYFWPLGLETQLLARVKGAERRAILKRMLAAGRAEDVPEILAASALTEAERRELGRIHPNFMGGEYLPDLDEEEVAIARIVIASTTQDVTSVYARRGDGCIEYRVVDEYGGDTLTDDRTRTSVQPLTLGELAAFFDGAWSIYDVLAMNFGSSYDLTDMLRFVVSVESPFYPQIGALYEQRITAWAAEMQPEPEDEEE